MRKSLPSRLEGERVSPEAVNRPLLREVLDYWKLLRGDEPMPCREAFDPVKVKRSLGLISITEVLPGGMIFDTFSMAPRSRACRIATSPASW